MSRQIAKLLALAGLTFALLAFLALFPGGEPRIASATANPLPPLLSCPNLDGSTDNKVGISDVLSVVKHYAIDYGEVGYGPLWDSVMPYNSTDPAGTGLLSIADVLYVVQKYNQTCPVVDTQIAKATRAIGDPLYKDILCDPNFADPETNCGGDVQFLTENASFLAGRGYLSTGIDVPGQGVHYVNSSIWDGVFNPTRPEGLVYNDGVLAAQLYYADGDLVGWGSDRDHNKGAVNTDALPCTAGCGWAGAADGWHWHKNLCTLGIGTPQVTLTIAPSQSACANLGLGLNPPVTCTFPPTPNATCNWQAAVGWMGHLWNWLPNANYTNAVDPNTLGCTGGDVWPTCGECGAGLCTSGEANGRFADCFPDTQGWNAYNCPQ